MFEDSNNYLRDFVCVDDICKLHEKMFDVDQSGIFNVGTGRPVSFETVAQSIANKHGGDYRIHSNARKHKVTIPKIHLCRLN